ncbi:Hypothetical protein, putative [Bodo saltans]|uniref:Uncharacterized protein n=1 Tax=Bodo saltans TaxID=75058 RepID=A0A0S4J579_BODSA|nr:Hypothetical protein, putative [Bodo saltans]|eukprot:CUG82709.1 Hypothetical protein, putative [Bodo saltans]
MPPNPPSIVRHDFIRNAPQYTTPPSPLNFNNTCTRALPVSHVRYFLVLLFHISVRTEGTACSNSIHYPHVITLIPILCLFTPSHLLYLSPNATSNSFLHGERRAPLVCSSEYPQH